MSIIKRWHSVRITSFPFAKGIWSDCYLPTTLLHLARHPVPVKSYQIFIQILEMFVKCDIYYYNQLIKSDI